MKNKLLVAELFLGIFGMNFGAWHHDVLFALFGLMTFADAFIKIAQQIIKNADELE
jgi:hypothetical protein